MGEIKSVRIVIEVIVKEGDYLFVFNDDEKQELASAVEDKLQDFKDANYRNDWTVLGTQFKKIK